MATKLKVKTFDAEVLGLVRRAIDRAFTDVEEEFGIRITLGKIKYSEVSADGTIRIQVVNKDGEALSQEAEYFKQFCGQYGFGPEDLGKTFYVNGKPFKLIGLMPGRPKYPFLATNKNGRRFKFQVDTVANALKRSTN
jgi:hypothetical protein